MSETDDTDVLLLIPPNFFLVLSSESEESLLESSRTVVHKPLSCTAQALGKLFNQVHSLESRLESLELDSSVSSLTRSRKTWDTSVDSRSLDRKCFTFPRRRRRKLGTRKSRDVSVTSFDTASTRKSILALDLVEYRAATVNEAHSMDGDISSIVSTPNKKDDKLLLHEIDEFLNRVECYESPETKGKGQDTISPENVIQATGDYISQKLDSKSTSDVRLPSGRIVPSDILDKYIYLVKNKALSQTDSVPLSSVSGTDNAPSNPVSTQHKDFKSPGIRRLNFSENKDINPTSTPKRLVQPSAYTESFNPTSNKIYDRASKVLEHYKSKNYSQTLTESELTLRKEYKMPQMRPFDSDREGLKLAALQMDSLDTDLLSLSELWGDRGDRVERAESLKLEEERLKREHCESLIQQLQKKILDQQEKLAVAMKVDKAKDGAIAKLKEVWLKLTGSLDRAEERHRAALEKMVHEVENFKTVAGEAQKKTSHFETELYKALDLAHDYQEKCKQLTTEKTDLQTSKEKVVADKEEEIRSKDKEIEGLKESYETVMQLNKQSTDCVKNLEDSLEKERSEHGVTKTELEELKKKMQSLTDEASLAQQEKETLKGKVNEERARCNMLERQLADSQNQSSELLKKCDTLDTETKTLRKLLEVQKTELKSHYQNQLEDAVLGKLQEFQQQLDLAERELESQARCKEAAIIDAYNKQITRIDAQHKLEVNVLEEKQKEEIKLYRLQLAQAKEKIALLEGKVEAFRRRRGQLAAQLHGVMEAQWRQALLILTHGQRGPSGGTTASATPLPQEFGASKPPDAKDFTFEGISDSEMHNYVKLLLAKPLTLDSEDAELTLQQAEEPTSDQPGRLQRREKGTKRSLTSKPPWKA